MNLFTFYKSDQSVFKLDTVQFMYHSILYYKYLISELSGHHYALDCVTHSDLSNTYAQREIFTW